MLYNQFRFEGDYPLKPSVNNIKDICLSESFMGKGTYGSVFALFMKNKGEHVQVGCKYQKEVSKSQMYEFLNKELLFAENFDYLKTFPKIIGCAYHEVYSKLKPDKKVYESFLFMEKLEKNL